MPNQTETLLNVRAAQATVVDAKALVSTSHRHLLTAQWLPIIVNEQRALFTFNITSKQWWKKCHCTSDSLYFHRGWNFHSTKYSLNCTYSSPENDNASNELICKNQTCSTHFSWVATERINAFFLSWNSFTFRSDNPRFHFQNRLPKVLHTCTAEHAAWFGDNRKIVLQWLRYNIMRCVCPISHSTLAAVVISSALGYFCCRSCQLWFQYFI